MSARRRLHALAPASLLVTGALLLGSIASPAFAVDGDEPAPVPTEQQLDPTPAPTESPDPTPTDEPTTEPTPEPTAEPTPEPTVEPTPTPAPTDEPTEEPASAPVLAVTTIGSSVLTLPFDDGYKDFGLVHIASDVATSVVVDVVDTTTSQVFPAITQELALTEETVGFGAEVAIPASAMPAGRYLVVARTATEPVAASTGGPVLTVGSGIAKTVAFSASAKTFYPYKDGRYDSFVGSVSAKDETGTALPITGSVVALSGTTKKIVAITKTTGTAKTTVSVAGLPLGSGSLYASVRGPAGAAKVSSSVKATFSSTQITSVAVAKSLSTVYPAKDGYKDTVSITTNAQASPTGTLAVTGTVKVTLNGKTITSWNLTKSSTTKFTWNGLNNKKVVPGTYTITVSEKGPQGATKSASTTVKVSAKKLVTTITSKWVTANTVIPSYWRYDSSDSGFCEYNKFEAVRCVGYDSYYNPNGYSIISGGSVGVPSAVRASRVYWTPQVRITADIASLQGSGEWAYGFGDSFKIGSTAKGVRSLGWLGMSGNPAEIEVQVGINEYTDQVINRFRVEYQYKVLK
ncbi:MULTISPECIES: hypothetical protein [unclassified Leifsonia]|uniref:hypothetical protein n=1 Tax=unclassified Leifsonia TaxID=2663824 RepID=UPI0006F919CB|nr:MULTISPECIES: hypothetical protein [unclassified Leifsonia]KQX07987.1 hypothetical protein ASC59_09850 [Leifsonia sp. Root1293]KRA12269.1 hypothetical protein ASD61_09850 [Leifsonia sp. Root60]